MGHGAGGVSHGGVVSGSGAPRMLASRESGDGGAEMTPGDGVGSGRSFSPSSPGGLRAAEDLAFSMYQVGIGKEGGGGRLLLLLLLLL